MQSAAATSRRRLAGFDKNATVAMQARIAHGIIDLIIVSFGEVPTATVADHRDSRFFWATRRTHARRAIGLHDGE